MQANQPKGGTEEATTNKMAVGDRVSYMQLRAEGRGYRFYPREGVITAIEGQVATVRASDGRHTTQRLEKLRPEGESNALSHLLAGGQ
jgi:hypothetical protein